MTKQLSQEVVVRKDIKLFSGESIMSYTKKVREQGAKWVRQKLNLDPKKADVFPIEIFSSAVIFDVYKYGDIDPSEKQKYFGVSYSRNKSGDFEFSTMMEVERITSFQPKQNTAVMKSMEIEAKKAFGVCDGWVQTGKDFWSGVL